MSETKVAAIIDNRRLVLSAGSESGVAVGDKYQIYAAEGKEIKDPDSGMVLGRLEIEKLPVKVVQVQEAFAVAETYRYHETNEGGSFNSFAAMSNYLAAPRIKREYESFEIEKGERKSIDEARSIIKVGDIARKIEETDE